MAPRRGAGGVLSTAELVRLPRRSIGRGARAFDNYYSRSHRLHADPRSASSTPATDNPLPRRSPQGASRRASGSLRAIVDVDTRPMPRPQTPSRCPRSSRSMVGQRSCPPHRRAHAPVTTPEASHRRGSVGARSSYLIADSLSRRMLAEERHAGAGRDRSVGATVSFLYRRSAPSNSSASGELAMGCSSTRRCSSHTWLAPSAKGPFASDLFVPMRSGKASSRVHWLRARAFPLSWVEHPRVGSALDAGRGRVVRPRSLKLKLFDTTSTSLRRTLARERAGDRVVRPTAFRTLSLPGRWPTHDGGALSGRRGVDSRGSEYDLGSGHHSGRDGRSSTT